MRDVPDRPETHCRARYAVPKWTHAVLQIALYGSPACFQRLGAIRNLYVEKVRDTHKAKQAAAIPTLSLQEQVLQLALAGAQRSLPEGGGSEREAEKG